MRIARICHVDASADISNAFPSADDQHVEQHSFDCAPVPATDPHMELLKQSFLNCNCIQTAFDGPVAMDTTGISQGHTLASYVSPVGTCNTFADKTQEKNTIQDEN